MGLTEIENKKLTLKSSDGEEFEVDEAVALQSQTMKHMMEDGCADNTIPLTGVILAKVIEYLKKHAEDKEGKDQKKSVKKFDADFVKQSVLFDLILAVKCLKIKKLWDLTCQTVADMIKDLEMSPEMIREIFNLKNDLTPEKEEAIRKEYQWALE